MKDLNYAVTKKRRIVNVLMSGVGGQGVLVASDILVMVAMEAGLDAKKSEIHGMAQRGGSVVSQVRFGEKIYSPLIATGDADIILAFEKLEAVRYLDYLKGGGVVIVNNQQITPLTVFFADTPYPDDIATICHKKTEHLFMINGMQIAEQLGNPRTINAVMLGALSNFLEFDESQWLKAIGQRVPPKTLDLNRKAFEAGKKVIG
ncbi:MAG: indolepyruvate oxidoreductase subunit beta [candidate division KSB1 bacterium]|nr:indolepyruvate oxidoreductase subunit beta [candidate division KSB1 bacterium]MDZ7341825.1 indolepyruvate oxidoreductase subunit beta [candidate division KSB1 bacterium]